VPDRKRYEGHGVCYSRASRRGENVLTGARMNLRPSAAWEKNWSGGAES
jgi:hypothetical protein